MIHFQDFGLADYERIWRLQKDLVQQRLAGEIPDTVLIGEHEPVITLGRGTKAENVLCPTIPVIEIERGGDVTYHGPGQLVVYPIFVLPEGRRDLHRYLRDLEAVIIHMLGRFGLEGTRNPGWTGVWVESPGSVLPGDVALGGVPSLGKRYNVQLESRSSLEKGQDALHSARSLKKIASIGVAVRKWVTYHGLALNVRTDLERFRQINPCGLESGVMTSLAELLPTPPSMQDAKEALKESFFSVFEW